MNSYLSLNVIIEDYQKIQKEKKLVFKNKKNVSRAEYIYRKLSKINAYLTVPRFANPLGTPISQQYQR